ncbi:MAG TPA: hypothetical protein VKV26_22075 [Dehalococcoidia bacterium]|nr:hypothetical protein [Dehalococcoidia bacterium]
MIEQKEPVELEASLDPAAPAAARPGTPQWLAHLYEAHIVRRGREERFLIAASFLTAFVIVRFITHSIHAHRFQRFLRNFSAGGGVHLHHLVFGIVGLLFGGHVAIGFRPQRQAVRRPLAILFGTSAALTMDEFALWLNLQDVYWARQGRESVDAAIVTGGVAVLASAGHGLFRAMGQDMALLWRDAASRRRQ